jgi:hypothetical protein
MLPRGFAPDKGTGNITRASGFPPNHTEPLVRFEESEVAGETGEASEFRGESLVEDGCSSRLRSWLPPFKGVRTGRPFLRRFFFTFPSFMQGNPCHF